MSRSVLPRHEARRLWSASGRNEARFRALEQRRMGGEPLQYLEGTAAFGPLELAVDDRVLIPRLETEQLWELAVSLVGRPEMVADLCTGSGALALLCKHTWPAARVVATDVSPDAIEVARLNVERLHLAVELFMGDLFEPLPPDLDAGFDLIVANPPYVSEAEWALLPIDVRHEPRLALVAGPAGTEVLDRIAREAGPWLAPGGWVVCEIGETQAEAAARGFGERFARVSVRPDLTGRPRFVAASVPRLHG